MDQPVKKENPFRHLTQEQRDTALLRGLQAMKEDEAEMGGLPATGDAERGFISGCIKKPELLDDYAGRLKRECFTNPEHWKVLETLIHMRERNAPINNWSVPDEVIRRHAMPSHVAHPLIMDICTEYAPEFIVPDLLERILEYHRLRSTYQLCRIYREHALTPATDSIALLADMEREIKRICDSAVTYELPSFKRDVLEWFDKLDGTDAMEDGLKTGLAPIDERMEQLDLSDTTVLAARPGCGKTALALQIALNMALDFGYQTALVSIEMNAKQVMDRLCAARQGVYVGHFRNSKTVANLSQRDLAEIEKFAHTAHACSTFHPLYPASIGAEEISRFARALHKKNGLQCLIVDYIQIMEPSESASRKGNREQEVSDMSRKLKLLAKSLNIHVIILAQLNREAEKSGPKLSSLRESGSLEQDASNVIFIDGDPDGEAREFIIAKARHGGVGSFPMAFRGGFQRFEKGSVPTNEVRQPYKH